MHARLVLKIYDVEDKPVDSGKNFVVVHSCDDRDMMLLSIVLETGATAAVTVAIDDMRKAVDMLAVLC